MKLKFAGIRRGKVFSPNHVENDAMILKRVGEEIERYGGIVSYYDEDMLDEKFIREKFVFSMVRSKKALSQLKKLEQNGTIVLNHVDGVLNCFRERNLKYMSDYMISHPKSIVVNTNDPEAVVNKLKKFDTNKLWVKRDSHAIHREDVTKVFTHDECVNILREYNRRGIDKAIIQEHIEGSELKFYAVRETEFFKWYYVNGGTQHEFDEDVLKIAANHTAKLTNVHFYGGDAIISEDGRIYIIDFNDWPSFARFRNEASKHIAKVIYSKAIDHIKVQN